MERRGEIIYPSRREFLASELGCFHRNDAAAVADALREQAALMIRGATLGDMATFYRAAAIFRIADDVETHIPERPQNEVSYGGDTQYLIDYGPDSPIHEVQRGYVDGGGSFVGDDILAALLSKE